VLASAQEGREVVQQFVSLAQSVEWNLGQQYLRLRGNKAFLSDTSPVPFVVNNDGTLSRNAAGVFFASLLEADKRGTLEDEVFILEIGIGVGLFARFFLDAIRDLCRANRKDYYERLCYVAADRSERMLDDVLRHGVLAHHPGRYRVRQVDAMQPETLLRDPTFRNAGAKPFRAVFLNYLLDCLPAAVLRFEGEEVRELHVRTCVARNVRLADYTNLTPQQLRERAKTNDPRAEADLLEVYGLFASEYDYRPVDPAKLPYADFAVEYGRRVSKRLLHSYGAIQCLEKLLPMLADGGFILTSEYGQTRNEREDEFEHQRFSLATAVGLNFSLLKTYFGDGKRCRYVEPYGEEGRGIHSRLLGHELPLEVVGAFTERFGEEAHRRLQEPIEKARACARAGRREMALGFYREAEALQPTNWMLLCEISQFLTFILPDPKAGANAARAALALNPTCSAELWNALGDALLRLGRLEEARSAYEKALAVNPTDVRAQLNLACVHNGLRDYPKALRCIAEAFALDKTGQYREAVMQKLQEILARLTQRNQEEFLLLINLVSHYGKKEEKPREPEEPLPAPIVVTGS
jgi:tetratricopeptide (TPR) repeat protein